MDENDNTPIDLSPITVDEVIERWTAIMDVALTTEEAMKRLSLISKRLHEKEQD